MRITKTYALYILLGLLYPTVKLIWYIKGLVYLRGVIYGLIAGVLTICIGILALNEYDGADKPVGHWLAALIPLIIISDDKQEGETIGGTIQGVETQWNSFCYRGAS